MSTHEKVSEKGRRRIDCTIGLSEASLREIKNRVDALIARYGENSTYHQREDAWGCSCDYLELDNLEEED